MADLETLINYANILNIEYTYSQVYCGAFPRASHNNNFNFPLNVKPYAKPQKLESIRMNFHRQSSSNELSLCRDTDYFVSRRSPLNTRNIIDGAYIKGYYIFYYLTT